MKFFSIITICRNNLAELKKTHDSILKQTSIDFEWIVIDGNSTDGTKDWLGNTNDSLWTSEPDNGIYDAMNKGISKATGKYLIFMNSGDCFYNENVLENSKAITQSQNLPAFVYGDSIDVSEEGVGYYRKAKNYKKNCRGMITQHQAMFFNKEKLNGLIYSVEYRLSGDYAFISSFLKNKRKNEILYLNFPVCKFSMGGVNETKRFAALKEDYKIREKIINLSIFSNLSLYTLHYLHAMIKKTIPKLRFVKHKQNN